jgi:hypothetical protein
MQRLQHKIKDGVITAATGEEFMAGLQTSIDASMAFAESSIQNIYRSQTLLKELEL